MTQDLFSGRKLGISGAFTVLLSGLAADPLWPPINQAPCSPPRSRSRSRQPVTWTPTCSLPGRPPTTSTGADGRSPAERRSSPPNWPTVRADKCSTCPADRRQSAPRFCVRSNFPTARAMVNDVTGNEGVQVSVSNNRTGGGAVNAGVLNPNQTGWTVSDPFDTGASTAPGQQHVQFTFTAAGTAASTRSTTSTSTPGWRADGRCPDSNGLTPRPRHQATYNELQTEALRPSRSEGFARYETTKSRFATRRSAQDLQDGGHARRGRHHRADRRARTACKSPLSTEGERGDSNPDRLDHNRRQRLLGRLPVALICAGKSHFLSRSELLGVEASDFKTTLIYADYAPSEREAEWGRGGVPPRDDWRDRFARENLTATRP